MVRLKNGLHELRLFTGELFEMTKVDKLILKHHIAVDLNRLKTLRDKEIVSLLDGTSSKIATCTFMQKSRSEGLHSAYLGFTQKAPNCTIEERFGQ
jgi:hypothetical protein